LVVFPIIAFVVSAACCFVVAKDTLKKPRPDRVVWSIAFGMFAIAAGAEVIGSLSEWTAPLAKVYYLTGAVLVVGYLALGELYLLARPRIERFAPGITLLITALATTLVINTPVDTAALAEDGWDALDNSSALTALTISINTIGTVILVAGALFSAWKFRKQGIQRHRMIGCLLIAIGTVVVAMGGTLVRFGHHEYLYIAMAIGVVVIFAGVLETRRTDNSARSRRSELALVLQRDQGGKLLSLPPRTDVATHKTEGARYIAEKLLPLDCDAIADACRKWSVPPRTTDELDREEARRAWALRCALPESARDQFDDLPVAIQGQLAELYSDVLIDPGEIVRSG
jgi:peptidoglycan/LPS O-acetylase OafA/YrhL